jgi:magnesium transporter
MARTHLTVDLHGERWQDGADISHLGEQLRDRENLLWLDIADPGPDDIELLRREFQFHELALEDVGKLELHQRPRCDRYDGYYFIVVYAAEHTEENYLLREIQMFWGENYLVTIHQGSLPVIDQARARWLRHARRQQHGIAYVAYALCDSVVDSYFPLQDWFGDRVEAIEDAVLTGKSGASGSPRSR